MRLTSGLLLSLLLWFGNGGYLGPTTAEAQPDTTSQWFSRAVDFFRSGDYAQAATLFGRIATQTPPARLSTASHVLFARSLYRLGRIDEATEALETFLKTYPTSRYVPFARYLLAACKLQQRDPVGAASSLLTVAVSKDSVLSQRAFQALAKLLPVLDTSEREKLEHRVRSEAEFETLQLALLEGWLQRGRLSEVIHRAEVLQTEAKSEEVRARAAQLAKIARNLKRGSLRVGVILPLTGYFQNEGKSLLRGIQFALRRNKPEGLQLDLVIRDSESSLLRAIKEAQEMVDDERVIALIGELESDKSIAIGAIAASGQLPTLVPVSSTTGVASVGKTVFQMNMDLEHRARVLATYAVNDLGFHNFAILAPADDYGIEMADAFAKRIDELGGTLVAQEWYYGSPQDLSKQFKKIRELGFLRFIADTLAASDTSATVPPREKVEAVWKALNDTLKAHADPGEPDNLVDEEDIPVYGIDAIFFPVYTEDIPYIAPQFARFNIRARPLGGSHWYDTDALYTNGRYVDSLIFVTDWFLDENDPVYVRFRDEFRMQMGANPDRWAAYGYDAMNLILKVLSQRATTREEVQRGLENLEKVQGIRGLTTFRDSHRVNSEVNLVRYARGRFEKIR